MLSLIVTDQPIPVSQRIMNDMHRGVTKIDGVGMYTGKEHSILMVALTATEVPQMKALVAEADPHGFVILTPAQEILGGGFVPLQQVG